MSFQRKAAMSDEQGGEPAPSAPRRRRKRNVLAAAASAAVLVLVTASVGAASSSSDRDAPSASDTSAAWGQTLPGFQQGYVPITGGKVHYVRGGSGPVLVLLHGWPETWWAWHDVMPELAEHHTVVAFDLPGLGKSSVQDGGYDAATTASRIREAVHALGYRKVDIMAHDMGALSAYDYARDHPAEVGKLAVLDSALNGFGVENYYGISFHFLLNQSPYPVTENIVNNQRSVEAYYGAIFARFAHKPEAVDEQLYFRAYANPAIRSDGYDYYRAWPQNAKDNVANAAKRLEMPVLAMGGQYAFGAGVGASLGQVADHVQTVVAPDSGHYIPEEAPAFLTACAELFFDGAHGTTPPADLASCVS